MFFSDQVTLRTVTTSTDSDGYGTEAYTDKTVWADAKSVTRSEFYSASANKINIVIAFDVHVEDFSQQTQVIYNSKTYHVVRAYQKGLGVVELNCSDQAVI